MHVENVVVGKPLVAPAQVFATDPSDWENVEKPKTVHSSQNSVAGILKELGIVPSLSEVRRNKPELCVPFAGPDYMEVKWGKRRLFILVGEKD